MAVAYETQYSVWRTKRKGPFKGFRILECHEYRTKTLTPMHQQLREQHPGSNTVKIDLDAVGPFGPFAEVIASNPMTKAERLERNRQDREARRKAKASNRS